MLLNGLLAYIVTLISFPNSVDPIVSFFKEDFVNSTERDAAMAVGGQYVLLLPPDKTNGIGANFARLDRRSSFDTFVSACVSDCTDSGLSSLDADPAMDYTQYNNDNTIV